MLDMFTRTVDKGERGVGKSALVTHALRSVQNHHVLIVKLSYCEVNKPESGP